VTSLGNHNMAGLQQLMANQQAQWMSTSASTWTTNAANLQWYSTNNTAPAAPAPVPEDEKAWLRRRVREMCWRR
jgi:hypothetical protein